MYTNQHSSKPVKVKLELEVYSLGVYVYCLSICSLFMLFDMRGAPAHNQYRREMLDHWSCVWRRKLSIRLTIGVRLWNQSKQLTHLVKIQFFFSVHRIFWFFIPLLRSIALTQWHNKNWFVLELFTFSHCVVIVCLAMLLFFVRVLQFKSVAISNVFNIHSKSTVDTH